MNAAQTTVVIPTWNSVTYLPRCLEALRATAPEAPIIVVDNASDDGTVEWIATHAPDVTLLANPSNEGFGAACNRGAATASTEFVCFLNPDAFVMPGWLDALFTQRSRVPKARLAVPMFLNLDGTLQEAGAMLSRTGDGILYGNTDDPTRWRYRFPRIVDYGSAACLLVDREAFAALDGFDVAAFGLAFYEDVDLCLRAAAHGWRTVYAPEATVTHVRNVTTGSASALALRAENQQIFAQRWRALLERRPLNEDLDVQVHREIAARDADRFERLLVICRDLPAPGSTAAHGLADVQRLWPNARVSILANSPPADAEANAWLALGIEVCDTPQDVHGWMRARVAAFTTVVALDAVAQTFFGALVEWTQTDIPVRSYRTIRPADPWRRPSQTDRFARLGTAIDPDRWKAVDPATTVPELLQTLGWPVSEVPDDADFGTRLH